MIYKVLIVYDVHCDTPRGRVGWAFWRRAEALKKYAPKDFVVDTMPIKDFNEKWCRNNHLIFNIEYAADLRPTVKRAGKDIVYVVSYNSDSRRRTDWWDRISMRSDWIICNNKEMFLKKGRQTKTCCISNGIDGDSFFVKTPIEQREHTVFWSGSTNPAKGKNLDTILLANEILERRGFSLFLKGVNAVDENLLTTSEIADSYNSSSYVICMSDSDASPNYLLEAAACGCVPVSVRVGNLQEFGTDEVNCIFIEKTADALIDGLLKAKQHRDLMSARIANVMKTWTYGDPGNRAAYYFSLFRNLINRNSIKPFSYDELNPEEIG